MAKKKGEKALTMTQQIEKGLIDRVESAKDISELAGLGFEVGRDLGSMLYHAGSVLDADKPFLERVETGMKAAAALASALATGVEQIMRLRKQKGKGQRKRKTEGE